MRIPSLMEVARWMMLTAGRLPVQRAFVMGAVHEILSDDEIDNLDRSAINHGPRPKRRAALNSGLVEEPVETAAAAQVDDDDEAEFEF